MSETGRSKSAMLAKAARRRLRGMAEAAARLGAQAAPKAGEPTPEVLQEGQSPDAMDLPLGVYPVGGRPQRWAPSETDLPGEQVPAQMQGRAAVDAISEAAAESGLKQPVTTMFFVPETPDAPVVVDQHPSVRDNPRVECHLTGHGREQIIDGMVGAFVEAARSGLRRTDNRYAWLDKARLARWDQLIAEPPQTDGLRERLTAAAAAGDDEDDLHDLAWFRRVAGRVEEAAFDAGVPMIVSCVAVRPSGFQVAANGVPPTALRESTWPDPGRSYGIRLYCHHHNPAEFAAHVIDAVLYGNCIDEGTDEHARLGREMWAAAVARFTPVPSAPPAG